MRRVVLVTGDMDDWYTIEWAEHEGEHGLGQVAPGVVGLTYTGRVSDACVEGSAAEMRALAAAIERRGHASFKRCGVRVEGDQVFVWSPRNSTREGVISLAAADDLVTQIRAQLGDAPVDEPWAGDAPVEEPPQAVPGAARVVTAGTPAPEGTVVVDVPIPKGWPVRQLRKLPPGAAAGFEVRRDWTLALVTLGPGPNGAEWHISISAYGRRPSDEACEEFREAAGVAPENWKEITKDPAGARPRHFVVPAPKKGA